MDGFHQATAAQKLIYDGKDEFLQRDLKENNEHIAQLFTTKESVSHH